MILQVRLPEKITLEKIDSKAMEFNQNRTDFVLNALNLMMNLDSEFLQTVTEESEKLNIPLWLYIQNSMIERAAQIEAEKELSGDNDVFLEEFIFTSQGVLTGQALFDMLKERCIKELELKHADFIIGHKVINGLELTPEEETLIDKTGKRFMVDLIRQKIFNDEKPNK